MEISAQQVKELREATGAGILDCRKALAESNGDFNKAVAYLREKGLAAAAKKAGREAKEGVIELYSHGGGRVGVMVEVNCETDFVSRSEPFRTLAHEIALQIAASAPLWVSEGQIPAAALQREREVAHNQAKKEGKKENLIDKVVEGRIEKYKDEVCLLRQPYIRNEDITIQQLLAEKIGSIGENIVVRRFQRWELGERIE